MEVLRTTRLQLGCPLGPDEAEAMFGVFTSPPDGQGIVQHQSHRLETQIGLKLDQHILTTHSGELDKFKVSSGLCLVRHKIEKFKVYHIEFTCT